jgi:hypothetical protein
VQVHVGFSDEIENSNLVGLITLAWRLLREIQTAALRARLKQTAPSLPDLPTLIEAGLGDFGINA